MKTILWTYPLKEDVLDAAEYGYAVCGIFPKTAESALRATQKALAMQVCDYVIETDQMYSEEISAELIEEIQFFGEFKHVLASGKDGIQVFHQTLRQRLGRSSAINAAKTVQDKFALRNFLNHNPKLKQLNPRYFAAQNIADLEQILHEIDYSIIVKPRFGSASQNIMISTSQEESKKILSYWQNSMFPRHGLVVEEFIQGTQYSAETLSLNGETLVLGITEKFSVLPPNFMERGGVFPAPLSPRMQLKVSRTIVDLLKILGYTHEFSHTEFFITDRDEVKIVECHLRRAGLIPNLFREVYGISWNKFYLQCLEKNRLLPLPRRLNELAILEVFQFIEGQQIGQASPSLREKANQFNLLIAGEIAKSVSSNHDRHGNFIVTAHDMEDAQRKISVVRDAISNELGILYDRQS